MNPRELALANALEPGRVADRGGGVSGYLVEELELVRWPVGQRLWFLGGEFQTGSRLIVPQAAALGSGAQLGARGPRHLCPALPHKPEQRKAQSSISGAEQA